MEMKRKQRREQEKTGGVEIASSGGEMRNESRREEKET